jgi:hypothetical protein
LFPPNHRLSHSQWIYHWPPPSLDHDALRFNLLLPTQRKLGIIPISANQRFLHSSNSILILGYGIQWISKHNGSNMFSFGFVKALYVRNLTSYNNPIICNLITRQTIGESQRSKANCLKMLICLPKVQLSSVLYTTLTKEKIILPQNFCPIAKIDFHPKDRSNPNNFCCQVAGP